MESFYKVTFTLMSSIGLQIEKKNENVFTKLLRASSFLILVCSIFQEFMFIIMGDTPVVQKITAFPCMLYVTSAIPKFIAFTKSREVLKAIISDLNQMHDKLEPKSRASYQTFVLKLHRFLVILSVCAFICVCLFNLMPIPIMWITYSISGKWTYMYPYFFWWPFDAVQIFKTTFIYQFYCGQVTIIAVITVEQLFMLLITQISGHLRVLAEDVASFINEHKNDKDFEKKFKTQLKKFVETHNKLIDHANAINDIFGTSILIQLLFVSLIICFTGFLVVVRLRN